MSTSSQDDASCGRRRSGAAVSAGGVDGAERGAAAAGHAHRLDCGRLDSGHRPGRAGRAGRRRHGVGARRLVGIRGQRSRAASFEMRTLSPGPYLLRAHLAGFVASRGQVVDVRPSARASSSIALRHVSGGEHAGVISGAGRRRRRDAPTRRRRRAGADPAATANTRGRDRQRRSRRARVAPAARAPDDPEGRDGSRGDGRGADAPSDDGGFGGQNVFGRVTNSSARLASNFFAATPFSGQVNLLTTGSFDTPQQLFSADNFAHNTAYLALGAPVGEHADWTVRAALTQGDIASWIVAGEYTTRAPARHRYDIGLSYSTQRYEGGNFATLRDVTDGSRNAGALYAFDTFSISPVADADLRRPLRALRLPRRRQPDQPARRADATSRPITSASARCCRAARWRRAPRSSCRGSTAASCCRRSARSPRSPPAGRSKPSAPTTSRSRSSATSRRPPSRCAPSGSTSTTRSSRCSASTCRTRRRRVGHYFLGNVGDVDASGSSAGVRAAIAGRVHGSVEYSMTRAHVASPDLGYMLVLDPSALRLDRQQIHDVATSIETEVPETVHARRRALSREQRVRPSRVADAWRRRSTPGSTCRSGSRCRSWTSATPSGRCWSRSAISSAKPPRISRSTTSCSSFVRPSASSAA